MKIYCYIPNDIYPNIEPWIDCASSANYMDEEYWFENPTEQFLVILALWNITLGTEL